MEPVIRVENVSKKYSRNADRHLSYGISDLYREVLGRKSEESLRTDEFLAVNNVSFQLFPGDTFALIGRNGSGKTTLLKMMTGLTKPDAGRIAVRGRVQALINLGAGFNPKLSGRENIFNSAALMGMSRKETNEQVDEIIDFSDLQDFIDSPVYTYSSGMKSRLGFSVAVSLKPEILFLDEILAVGDFAFQNRCFARMQQLKKKGVTIVLVSHAHNSVIQLCDKALWLHRGTSMQMGNSKETVKAYLRFIENEEAQRVAERNIAARKATLSAAQKSGASQARTIIFNDTFGDKKGKLPGAWHPLPKTDLESDISSRGEEGLILSPPMGEYATGFETFLQDLTIHLGRMLEICLEAQSEETDTLGINLYFIRNGETVGYSRNHPGNGAWMELVHKVTLPEDADPESVRLLIRLRPGATRPAIIRNCTAILETPSPEETTIALPADPYDGLYGPIHPDLNALSEFSFNFRPGGALGEGDSMTIHDSLDLEYSFSLSRPVQDLNVTLKFFRKDGLHLTTISTLNGDFLNSHNDGSVSCTCSIVDFDFTPGTYVLVLAIHEGKSYLYRNVVKEFSVTGCGRFTWGLRELRYIYSVDGKTVYKTD